MTVMKLFKRKTMTATTMMTMMTTTGKIMNAVPVPAWLQAPI